jgi:hypothetical protein
VFDLAATCRKLGIWEEENPGNKERSVAIRAIPAIPIPKNSQNSQNSRSSPLENSNRVEFKAELKVARQLFSKVVLLGDEEIINRKIGRLKLRDDRNYVRNQLKGIPGNKRLVVINQYFDEWQKGMDEQPDENKKENAGRKRANTWLRTLKNRGIQNVVR